DLTCEAYNTFYRDIVERAGALGAQGSAQDSSGLFGQLDSLFGTYRSIATDQGFEYSNITCNEESQIIQVADTAHDGAIDWITEVTKTTVLDTTEQIGSHGIVDIVCSAEVVQDIWIDLDDCGNGTLTRRFYISGGCTATAASLVLEQVIRVRSACSLQESMFDLPVDLGSSAVPVCLSQPLSAEYFPESLGLVTHRPHLAEVLC